MFISLKDASVLMAALQMKFGEFKEAFCRWVPLSEETEQLSLKEKPNFDCIFWKTGLESCPEGGCSVYESRPLQCRAFPFWSSVLNSRMNWQNTARECPGMDSGVLHSCDSIKKWLAARQKEPIIFRSKRNV